MPQTMITLPLLPLRSGVVLPGMTFTLALESDEARAAADAAGTTGGKLLLVPYLDDTYAGIGVVAEITERGELPGGMPAAVVHGETRARIGTGVPGTGTALWVEAEIIEASEPTEETTGLAREYRAVLENILVSRGAGRIAAGLRDVTDPSQLADVSGYSPDLSLAQKLQVLETLDVTARLRLVLSWARDTLAEVALRERIKGDVEEGMERSQREFLLRRQLDAIKKELAQLSGEETDEPLDYTERFAGIALPDDVRTAVDREIAKLERTSDQSPEVGWIRTWLDTVSELPWGTETPDNLDLDVARRVLDGDHDGLDDVKDRIVEQLAVRKLRQERGLGPTTGRGSGAIVVLVGPPGVGKTSLGESIASALGRTFVRVALGGVRDEAEIRGHRRTYVGAQPGRLVRALREAKSMNPVIMLDEIDKIGADYRGDPASALLEVLDPAQNHTFRDHYLEVDLDLSKVLFLATANVIDTIPQALLDRMELIRIDGYTESEKVAIATNHLLPRQLERAGLRAEEIEVTSDALRCIVADYTREAGVRGLERMLAKLLRKVATVIAKGDHEVPVVVNLDSLRSLIGRAPFSFEAIDTNTVAGVATGLAVTGVGGDVLTIEASSSLGNEGLTLTGQLGDVMRESAEIALSYIRSHHEELSIPADAFTGRRFHLHVPAGAVPKDGPSAGITMATALISLLRDQPVTTKVAMTGEVTLQGRVLPIGGIKQKVLAAHRAGMDTVIVPKRNAGDLEDVPSEVAATMTFIEAATMADVLAVVLPEVATTAKAHAA